MPYSHGSADARRESNRRRASKARTNVSAISSSARLCPTRSWRYRNTVAACRSNSTSNSSGWLSERRTSTASLGVVVLIDPGFAADADTFQCSFKRSDTSPTTVEPRPEQTLPLGGERDVALVGSWRTRVLRIRRGASLHLASARCCRAAVQSRSKRPRDQVPAIVGDPSTAPGKAVQTSTFRSLLCNNG